MNRKAHASPPQTQTTGTGVKYCLLAGIPLLLAAASLPLFLLDKAIERDGYNIFYAFLNDVPFIFIVIIGLLNPLYQIALSGWFALRRGGPLPLCWAISLCMSCAYSWAAYYCVCVAPGYFVRPGPYDSLGDAFSLYLTWVVAAVALVLVCIGLTAISCIKVRRGRKAA